MPIDAYSARISAAIHIARARRSVCVIDAGNPRNRFANSAHGFFGQDGSEPRAMIASALAQFERYLTVQVVAGEAVMARAVSDGFEVSLASGETRTATKLVLAFGIRFAHSIDIRES